MRPFFEIGHKFGELIDVYDPANPIWCEQLTKKLPWYSAESTKMSWKVSEGEQKGTQIGPLVYVEHTKHYSLLRDPDTVPMHIEQVGAHQNALCALPSGLKKEVGVVEKLGNGKQRSHANHCVVPTGQQPQREVWGPDATEKDGGTLYHAFFWYHSSTGGDTSHPTIANGGTTGRGSSTQSHSCILQEAKTAKAD